MISDEMEELKWIKELQEEYAERRKHGVKNFHYSADPDSYLKSEARAGDEAAIMQLFMNASDNGLLARVRACDADAECELAEMYSDYFEDKDYAIWLFKQAAEHGSVKAMFALGELYFYDDASKANSYFEKVVELSQDKKLLGNACKYLGDFYMKSTDASKDYDKAAFYFRKMAKECNGYLRAQGLLWLARCYQAEDNANKDTYKAFLMFSELAKIPMEINEAFKEIIHCYDDGIGVEKNEQFANELRRLISGR